MTDGTAIGVDVYGAASCSLAKATASRVYALDDVPRRLTVHGTRLTYRGTRSGSDWTKWTYRGRRHRRAVTVVITETDPPPAPAPAPPSPAPAPTPPPACDVNYQGACLDPYAVDYDCLGGSGDGPLYTGPVVVVGNDHYRLDGDGDGLGCESS